MYNVEKQNNNIEYIDVGTGSIVVLLHGFGENNSIWQHQINFLQNNYRLIVPNIPGTGKSALLQQQDVSISNYATCIYQFLQQIIDFNKQKIILLGHSMGGYITLAYAKMYGNTLSKLGLIHSTAFADSEEKKQNRWRGIEMMKEYGAYAFLKNTIPNLFTHSFKQQSPQEVDNLIQQGQQFSVAALEQYYKAMITREDNTETLQQITVPVLFIMGTEDVATPLNDVLQQCHLPRISTISILENVGHMGMLEATSVVNETIASFLAL